MGLVGSGQDGGLNAAMGGLEFHPSRERGRWARRLPHLPATFEGELERRTGGFIAEVRLRGGGAQGTPLQRYIRTYSGGMDGCPPAFSCKWIQCDSSGLMQAYSLLHKDRLQDCEARYTEMLKIG